MHATGASLHRHRLALAIITLVVLIVTAAALSAATGADARSAPQGGADRLAAALAQATTPTLTCPAGQAPRTIERRTRCAPAAQLIGPVRTGQPAALPALLTASASSVLPRRSGPRRTSRLLAPDQGLRRIAPRAGRQLAGLTTLTLSRVPQPAARAQARRATRAQQSAPTVTVTPTDRGGTARATQQFGRTSIDLQIGSQRPADGQVGAGESTGEVTLEATAEGGAKARITTATSSSSQADECPSALGTVLADSTGTLRRTVTVQLPGKGAASTTTRVRTEVQAIARVGNDARLDYADVDIRRTTEVAARGLIYQQQQRTTLRLNLRGAAPAPTPTSGDTQVRIRSATPIAGQPAIEREMATEGDANRASDAADEAGRIVDVLREAEANWRKPNACAKLTLDPPSPKEGVAPREQVPLRARLTAADGDLVAAGSIESRPLIGTVDPSQRTTDGNGPAEFTVTAADKQEASSIALTNFSATSRAGIAEATFEAKLGIPNRWTGSFSDTFTDSDGLSHARTGTVTFVRDDAAVRDSGYPLEGQAGYRVEQVSYRSRITGTDVAGCVWNVDASSTQQATSIRRSALVLELQPDGSNTRAYSLVTSWNAPLQPFAIVCPPPAGIVQVTVSPDADLTVAPGPRPRITGLSAIDGRYVDEAFSASGRTYTWSLRPAP